MALSFMRLAFRRLGCTSWSRLDIMPAKRSNGGGPTTASRSFAEELYKEREQQQLGSVFQVVGVCATGQASGRMMCFRLPAYLTALG